MCSLAVAEGLEAAALVLVSYPLHPPGKPDRLRTEHFAELDVPCLFVSGRRDAFATPSELEREVAPIPGPVTVTLVDGDHALRRSQAEVGRRRRRLGRRPALNRRRRRPPAPLVPAYPTR